MRSQSPKSSTSCLQAALAPLDSTQGESAAFNAQYSKPEVKSSRYLRPETAQGHFVNFSRLLDFNNNRLPFASAQVGRSFRNEISPRAGLLRVREFTMAEIEHYVDPEDKSHESFSDVRHIELSLLDRHVQTSGSSQVVRMSIGDAVEKGIVANETLGYFLARIYLFLIKIGIDPNRLRFRQHMANEMAHYATDCWDAEIENSVGGWTECVGCADRAAYDLSVHSKRTGHPLIVRQQLPEPVVYEKEVVTFNKKVFGKSFGRDGAALQEIITNLDEPTLLKIKGELAQGYVIAVNFSSSRLRMCELWVLINDFRSPLIDLRLSPRLMARSSN